MLAEHATHEDGGNGVEAGVMEMLDRMQTGRLKVFSIWRMVQRVPAVSPRGRQDRERARRPSERDTICADDETLCRYRAARVSAPGRVTTLKAAGCPDG
jgi:hypothetical protein